MYTWLLVLLALVAYFLYRMNDPRWQRIKHMAGLSTLPCLGVLHHFSGKTPRGLTVYLEELHAKYPSPQAFTGPFQSAVHLYRADHVEALLKDKNNIQKSHFYDFVHCWLRNGLLTSTGAEWHQQRKLITPSFHYDILKEFLVVMDGHARHLVQLIGGSAQPVDVRMPLTLAALDIIAETSMGVNLDSLSSGEGSTYSKAIQYFGEALIPRAMKPWLRPDAIWFRTAVGKEFARQLKVISQREEERRENPESDDGAVAEKLGRKRYALLETLLRYKDKHLMDRQQVKQQVDTFMFEGHDTSATGLIYCVFNMAKETHYQRQVQREIDEVMDGLGADEPLSADHLVRMPLLDRCIKESLRLYPPVPYFARMLTHELNLGPGKVVPAGVVAEVFARSLHRDPQVWPEPDRFNPDNFLPENVQNRHPFAYVPFSGGPRNCIGQKFAVNELKVCLAHLLRAFDLCTSMSTAELEYVYALVLRPEVPVHITFTPRT